MASNVKPILTVDEVDDLLYFTRVNEAQDLHQAITELTLKYQCAANDILEACKDPENGNTVLHYCTANGFADLLPSLLSKLGAQAETKATEQGPTRSPLIDRQNQEGSTPLHWAAYNGHLEVVKLLIGAGANMWTKNAAGHLAMFEAERADRNDVVQYLLEAGGKEVERAGTEGQPSAEDVAEVEQGDVQVGPSTGVASATESATDRMEE